MKWLYELMYNNVLLPRRREIDREEEREAFNGTTDSLVKLYRENQITYEEFLKLPEAEIQRIIDKSKDLEISKERFFYKYVARLRLNERKVTYAIEREQAMLCMSDAECEQSQQS